MGEGDSDPMPNTLVPPQSEMLPGKLSDWRRTLATHYKRLGRSSRQRRFMAPLPDQSLQIIADRASPDIVLGVEADDRIVGVLELFVGDDAHAEIGISVEDAYQGQGFGRALFLDGLAAADDLGVRTADLFFASENHGIRRLVHAAGGKVLERGAECEAHIDISRCKACRDAARDAKGLATERGRSGCVGIKVRGRRFRGAPESCVSPTPVLRVAYVCHTLGIRMSYTRPGPRRYGATAAPALGQVQVSARISCISPASA